MSASTLGKSCTEVSDIFTAERVVLSFDADGAPVRSRRFPTEQNSKHIAHFQILFRILSRASTSVLYWRRSFKLEIMAVPRMSRRYVLVQKGDLQHLGRNSGALPRDATHREEAALGREDKEEQRFSSPGSGKLENAEQHPPVSPQNATRERQGGEVLGEDDAQTKGQLDLESKRNAEESEQPGEVLGGADAGRLQSTVILLALQEGVAGAEQLQEWAMYAQQQGEKLPPMWVVCPEYPTTIKTSVEKLAPHFQPFVVAGSSLWSAALQTLLLQVWFRINAARPPWTSGKRIRAKNGAETRIVEVVQHYIAAMFLARWE